MNKSNDILLDIELPHLAEIESLLAEEITLKDELAKSESLHLAKIENLLDEEKKQQIKWTCYEKLCNFCDVENFPCAIALIESLARHLPHDLEVKRWQARTYQRWGRRLIEEKQITKARIYLKKALNTDPHNDCLWSEVEQDFRRLEMIFISVI